MRKAVKLQRLRDIPIQMTQQAAKTSFETMFPEAQVDVHHKQFTFDVNNTVFRSASADWDWGCNCLEGIEISFDWTVWQKARDQFVACLSRVLGEPTKRVPPAVFEWNRIEDAPRLEIGWQIIRFGFGKNAKQAGYQREIDAMARCTGVAQ